MWYIASIPRLRAFLTRNAECLDTALSRGILAILQSTEEPYCYYKLATNVNRAVKLNIFLIPVVYVMMCRSLQPFRIQGSNHPVYN